MAVSRVQTSSIVQGFPKSRSLLAGNPSYVPPSFESIATATGTGSSDTITFSSIPSTYKHLQFRLLIRGNISSAPAPADSLIRLNSDSGSNYASHEIAGDGTSASASGVFNNNYIFKAPVNFYGGTSLNTHAVAIVDIVDYASTTKNKTIRTFSGVDNNTSYSGFVPLRLSSGLWRSTSAVNEITFYSNAGNFTTTSVISLYGIRG